MEKVNIICVDDERNILDYLSQSLSFFSDVFNIEKCESALECLGLLEDLDSEKKLVALVISDNTMPGKTGEELLDEIETDYRFIGTKKLLLTDPSSQMEEEQNRLGYFLEKVCDPEELLQTVKELVTQFFIDKGLDVDGYAEKLDSQMLSRTPHLG